MEKGSRSDENLRPLDFKTSLYRRPEYKPAVSVYQPISNCGHPRPTVRNVTSLHGAAAYVCRECYGYLCRVEVKAVVRRQVAALFGKLLPLGEIRGALGEVKYA